MHLMVVSLPYYTKLYLEYYFRLLYNVSNIEVEYEKKKIDYYFLFAPMINF